MTSQHQHLFCSPVSPQLVVITRRKCPPTTRVERLLLLLIILFLPLESVLPGIGDFSPMFFIFAISSIYIVIRRFGSIIQIWNHRVFLASYVLIFISVVLETFSPFASYNHISSIALMFIGAIVIATLCRDIKALKLCIFGCILTGVVASFYLFLSVYRPLQGATATDFGEGGRVTAQVFEDESRQVSGVNPFYLASAIAPCVSAALAIALMSRSAFVSYSLFGIVALGFIASFLPSSRRLVVATLLACMAVVLAYGRVNRGASFQRFTRIIAVILVLGMCTLLWVPHAVFARLTVPSSTPYEDSADPRVTLYNAALANLPEYWLVGVGAGNYWSHWGQQNGFLLPGKRGVLGAHNSFVQVMINWGLPGLLSLISVIYYAYKCLPKKCGNNPFNLAVLGLAVPPLVALCVSHVLQLKGGSLMLGILIGTQYWIWPAGETQLLGRMVRKTLA
jgi:hypothetical protein